MRLGAPLSGWDSPESWVDLHRRHGYRAAYCPVGLDADSQQLAAFRKASEEADLVIPEVGAWSNPLSRDDAERKSAIEKCRQALAVADELGATCAVNIAGSLGEKWDGPCAEDLDEATFDLVVESVRSIIDAVKPKAACYSLEPMPWMFPHDTESYARLIEAVDRDRFGVHYDPVNLVNSPDKYFRTHQMVDDFIDRLGSKILVVHVKDVVLRDHLTVHLDEVVPGDGGFDLAHLVRRVNGLAHDVPMLLEHLSEASEYDRAARQFRSVAASVGVSL